MPPESEEWQVTTDRSRIRQWAEQHDAVPVRDEDAPGVSSLGLVLDPGSRDTEGLADAEQITWDQFFELFEAEGLAVRYRDADPRESGPVAEIVDRTTVVESAPAAGDSPGDVASDRIVASDTGEGEPVIDDRVESRTGDGPDPIDGGGPNDADLGRRAPKRIDEIDRPNSPASESASGAQEAPLVLEELYEDPGGLGSDPDDEYLVFRNDSGERVELGGWRVENDLGKRYEFPDGFVLGPGEEVTLHSGSGDETETDLYWDAADSVWDQQGGVVVVRSPDGRRVLREPYKDG